MRALRKFACCFICVYPIGVPCCFVALLWHVRGKIIERDPRIAPPRELAHLALLFDAYTPDCCYWEAFECVRRLLLTSLLVFVGASPKTRTAWGVLFALALALVFGEVRPCNMHVYSCSQRASFRFLLGEMIHLTCRRAILLAEQFEPCKEPDTQAFAYFAQWHIVLHFIVALILSADISLFGPRAVGVLLVVANMLIIVGAFQNRRRSRIQLVEEQRRAAAATEAAAESAAAAHDGRGRHSGAGTGGSSSREAKRVTALPCVLICDPGREVDTELALVLLRVLRDHGHLIPKGIIANLWPQAERARLLRGTLDALGLHDVPVGTGTNGGSSAHVDTFSSDATATQSPEVNPPRRARIFDENSNDKDDSGGDHRRPRAMTTGHGFDGGLAAAAKDAPRTHARLRSATTSAASYMPAEGSERARTIVTGHRLLMNILENAEPHSVVLLCTSSLKVCVLVALIYQYIDTHIIHAVKNILIPYVYICNSYVIFIIYICVG